MRQDQSYEASYQDIFKKVFDAALIFTDGYTWIFYYKTLEPKNIIKLRDEKGWKYGENSLDDYVQNLLETNMIIKCEPKEWGELHSYIHDFVVVGNY